MKKGKIIRPQKEHQYDLETNFSKLLMEWNDISTEWMIRKKAVDAKGQLGQKDESNKSNLNIIWESISWVK
jgi:hypothetical protein